MKSTTELTLESRLASRVAGTALALLAVACGLTKKPSQDSGPGASVSATARASVAPRAVLPVPPTRLLELPVSAYATALALDENAVYLLAPHGAYRLAPGEAVHRIELELGIGPTATRSSFIFWADGGIWKAPKTGGETRRLSVLPVRPQYFVASGEDFAWISLSDDGIYSIQTLADGTPKTLVAGSGEISALDMIGSAVYFVERPTPGTWRLGVVRIKGGVAEYASERSGRRPAMLSGEDAIYYYDVDRFKVREVSLDLRREDDLATDLVCSPLHVARGIYCGCVEGLFELTRPSHTPRVLSHNRPGLITNVASDARKVVWTVDLGSDRLAVDSLNSVGPDD